MRAAVLGTGSCLPEKVLTNTDLEKLVETSDEWITTRTGIRTRRIAGPGEENYKLASTAARRALEMAKVTPEELDLVVVATLTPHMMMPSSACFVQAEIGAVNAFAYDLNAACSGFLYGLDLVDSYIARRPDMKILLIGSETLSARVNWEDRNTCILFGDGAGACVITGREQGGVVASRLLSDGRLWKLLYMDSPESRNSAIRQPDRKGCYIQMSGRDVFKYAVRAMEDAVTGLLLETGTSIDQVDLMIPHQANIRILGKLMERLGVPDEKLYINVDKYGNTSAASIPIALDEANRQGILSRGQRILLCSFGGGFTWGALLMDW
ncbi:3-oxoacyl-[acyl-carrier-protein] synthase 3 [Desulfolithobacter dissulfuricans]|uniref:Beta-ketoacyl-[acyl-carrier-protein] synthase III n=1 Tax=Desulfolithobacter dissulfuricans TaxID=2795293 RepID=A0A915U0A2_9BACT|nr:beta-ketoacyl-ACP synthase III [Desulfolithobacter dissulfuricans]BCO08649.1 3-oxoacyl-[acyl-carrier-protein] synthase 3 [Desulfolithobacter dissulfuricans]